MSLGQGGPDVRKIAFGAAGSGSSQVLVLAGVHGSEQAGIETVQILTRDLAEHPPRKHCVTVVPVLFPANYALSLAYQQSQAFAARKTGKPKPQELLIPVIESEVGRYTLVNRKPHTDPNRQFPPVHKGLSTCRQGGRCIVAAGKKRIEIENENLFLINLIDRLKPVRIVTVHALMMRMAGNARQKITQDAAIKARLLLPGVFVDPVTTLPVGQEPPQCSDDELALKTAAFVAAKQDEAIKQGLVRSRYGDDYDRWVVGNWLGTPNESTRYFTKKGQTQPGFSLGEWAPRDVKVGEANEKRQGIPVFTIEVRRQYPSSAYLTFFKGGGNPSEQKENVALKAEYAERTLELEAHAAAIRTVLIDEVTI